MNAMTNRTKLTGIFLALILFVAPASAVYSDSDEKHGDKVLLSLQLAKIKKDHRKTQYYKSIIRQKKLKTSLTDSPSYAR